MARFFFILITSLTSSTFSFGQNLQIKGYLDLWSPAEKVFIYINGNGEKISDSVEVKNKYFKIRMDVDEPVLAYLIVRYQLSSGDSIWRISRIPIFLEPGKIYVSAKGDLHNATVMGSKSQKKFDDFSRKVDQHDKEINKLKTAYHKYNLEKDEVEMNRINDAYLRMINEKYEDLYIPFNKKNSTSPVALYLLDQLPENDIGKERIAQLFDGLSEKIKRSGSGIEFVKKMEKMAI